MINTFLFFSSSLCTVVRFCLSFLSWKLFKDAPKPWLFKPNLLVTLVVCVYSYTIIYMLILYQSKVKFLFVLLHLGGQGVPPGTKRERCKACNGSGMVSVMLQNSSLATVIMIFFCFKWFLRWDCYVFSDNNEKGYVKHPTNMRQVWWSWSNLLSMSYYTLYIMSYE